MDKAELIRTITEANQRATEALANVSDDWLGRPVDGSWTGKDLVAHMAYWHDHSARVIESLRSGQDPYDQADPANATDALNARVYDEQRDVPAERLRQDFHDSFARLLRALEPASEEELFATDRWPWLDGEALAETILWDTSRHYDDHPALSG